VVFDALATGDVGVYVEYTGTVWTNLMHRDAPASRWSVLHQVQGWLASQHGIRSLGDLGFENAYALAMRRDRARELGVNTIADLSAIAALA
jgi:osmoprotectant transport system substrate-binding protein/osmoprotectant transport system permease protein